MAIKRIGINWMRSGSGKEKSIKFHRGRKEVIVFSHLQIDFNVFILKLKFKKGNIAMWSNDLRI